MYLHGNYLCIPNGLISFLNNREALGPRITTRLLEKMLKMCEKYMCVDDFWLTAL